MPASVPLWIRRLVALALLLAVVGGVGAAVALPVVDAFEAYDKSIADLSFRLARFNRTAAEKAPLLSQVKALEARVPKDSELLPGDSEALAGANLQEQVKQIIIQSAGTVESVQTLPTVAEGVLDRIAIRVQFTGAVPVMQRVLYAVESGEPRLFVDNLDTRVVSGQHRKGTLDPTRAVILRVILEIQGYRRGGAGDPA